MKNKTRILLFDIENAPNVSYSWGKWQQDIPAFKREWYMLSFAYKWFGGKRVKAKGLPDYSLFKKDKRDDRELVKDLWELFDKADIIIAHNADRFDVRKANARFLVHGLTPPSPYKTIDTLKIARKYFMLNSNKLDDIGKLLKIGRKERHYGFELWTDCMDGDKKAWEIMLKYNKKDVKLLEEVYLKLRAWHISHPNFNTYEETIDNCPTCNSDNVHKRGLLRTKLYTYQRYKCNNCGRWSKGERIKTDKVLIN